MSITRLYNICEAGVANGPVKNKKRKTGHANGMGQSTKKDEPESDWDEDEETDKGFGPSDSSDDDLGPDMDYEDPAADDDSEGDPSAHVDDDDDKPAAPVAKFSSKSQPPTKLPLGSGTGLTISGDEGTIKALVKVLATVNTHDDDLAEWVDDCVRALELAVRKGVGNATLPKFEATPSLDSYDDDAGGSDEDY